MSDTEWQSMKTAIETHKPEVLLKLGNGEIVVGHFAEGDGDGLMPPYIGWFTKRKGCDGYIEVKPVAWKPMEGATCQE